MPSMPSSRQDLRQLVVDRVHQVDPVGERRQPGPRVRQRLGVPVEPDQHRLREGRQHRLGVTAQPERGVHVHRRAAASERGGQQLEAALKQHRHMRAA